MRIGNSTVAEAVAAQPSFSKFLLARILMRSFRIEEGLMKQILTPVRRAWPALFRRWRNCHSEISQEKLADRVWKTRSRPPLLTMIAPAL